jgi:hypothetical protein
MSIFYFPYMGTFLLLAGSSPTDPEGHQDKSKVKDFLEPIPNLFLTI